ncbi:MAG: hypothetical protein K2N64_03625 [Anaeroplasmataceae bacterium]|nr:hypothetical protein [Anaeroplasmataceae bacterium]
MKLNVLKLQKYIFYIFTIFTFLLFTATIFFSTSYYNTFLYGNEELVEYYSTDLQSFNQTAFVYALVLVILLLVCFILQPKKYYPSFVTFPIFVVILLVGIVFGILIFTHMLSITTFYHFYDYSGISKLDGFQGNMFFPVFLGFSAIGLVVINFLSIGAYSLGFWQYLKGRGEALV